MDKKIEGSGFTSTGAAVESEVRQYLEEPQNRHAALSKLRVIREEIGQECYEELVTDACAKIIHELGHPAEVLFPGELRFETGSRLAVSGWPKGSH